MQFFQGWLTSFMARTISDEQLSRTSQGFFKDKLQFSRTKIYFTNLLHKLAVFNPLWSPYWLTHVMESFVIFTSSAIIDQIILYYFPNKTLHQKWVLRVLIHFVIYIFLTKWRFPAETQHIFLTFVMKYRYWGSGWMSRYCT